MYQKLKSLLSDDTIFTILIICCVAVSAFSLGRLSVVGLVTTRPAVPPSVQVTATELPRSSALLPAALPPAPAASGAVVASKNGTKYHYPTCPGAAAIKTENIVHFATAAAAEAAGYTKAANCSES